MKNNTDVIVFTDAAMNPEKTCAGIAAIAYGQKGNIVGIATKRIKASNIQLAELNAIKLGARCVPDDAKNVILFNDNLPMVDAMNGYSETGREISNTLKVVINELRNGKPVYRVKWVDRDHNRIADVLSDSALCGTIDVSASNEITEDNYSKRLGMS